MKGVNLYLRSVDGSPCGCRLRDLELQTRVKRNNREFRAAPQTRIHSCARYTAGPRQAVAAAASGQPARPGRFSLSLDVRRRAGPPSLQEGHNYPVYAAWARRPIFALAPACVYFRAVRLTNWRIGRPCHPVRASAGAGSCRRLTGRASCVLGCVPTSSATSARPPSPPWTP